MKCFTMMAKITEILFLSLMFHETSDFSMSFIGEVCSVAEIIKIKDADQQFISDCT